MSMELLGNEFIEAFYSPADGNRARRTHLEGIIGVLGWIATVDAFQHWIYTHANHTRAERATVAIQPRIFTISSRCVRRARFASAGA